MATLDSSSNDVAQPSGAGLTYEQCGVSISAQDEAIEGFRAAVEASQAAAAQAGAGKVLAGVGSFGATFAPQLAGLEQPLLVSSTDGIGTKVRLHARFGTHAWAGEDLVAAVINDVLCQGARPLFFLDYIACNKLDPAVVEQLVSGMAQTCTSIGCALVGGEIAEMGDTYQQGEYDLAGFAVGVCDAKNALGPQRVADGDAIIGLASSGVHCNGFSLVRRLYEPLSDEQWRQELPELGLSLHDVLLRPTRCYAPALRATSLSPLAGSIHAAAHISGGGLPGNLPRSLPDGLGAVLDPVAIRHLARPTAALFDIIQGRGNVAEAEMWRVFNMGVGFTLCVARESAEPVVTLLHAAGFAPGEIGRVQAGAPQFCLG